MPRTPVPVPEGVLAALERVTRTDQVRRDLDTELFETELLDSLGTVELLVLLSDGLGIELSPAELERDNWSTPRKVIAFCEARVAA